MGINWDASACTNLNAGDVRAGEVVLLPRKALVLALVVASAAQSACGSKAEPRTDPGTPSVGWVCFDLRRGAPIQSGLDFYGLFLTDGDFIEGIAQVEFDSVAATASVELEPGVDGTEWVRTLRQEILESTLVESRRISDRGCG